MSTPGHSSSPRTTADAFTGHVFSSSRCCRSCRRSMRTICGASRIANSGPASAKAPSSDGQAVGPSHRRGDDGQAERGSTTIAQRGCACRRSAASASRPSTRTPSPAGPIGAQRPAGRSHRVDRSAPSCAGSWLRRAATSLAASWNASSLSSTHATIGDEHDQRATRAPPRYAPGQSANSGCASATNGQQDDARQPAASATRPISDDDPSGVGGRRLTRIGAPSAPPTIASASDERAERQPRDAPGPRARARRGVRAPASRR